MHFPLNNSFQFQQEDLASAWFSRRVCRLTSVVCFPTRLRFFTLGVEKIHRCAEKFYFLFIFEIKEEHLVFGHLCTVVFPLCSYSKLQIVSRIKLIKIAQWIRLGFWQLKSAMYAIHKKGFAKTRSNRCIIFICENQSSVNGDRIFVIRINKYL